MPVLRKKEDTKKLPKDLVERINRGRERLQSIASSRDEAWEFYRGNHYAYVDENNKLQVLPTVTTVRGTGKARWKARQKRNLIFDVVLTETSAASQRVPSYQVVPSTSDPEDVGAARLSEKVALYGYERWSLRRATVDAVKHAIVAGESFAWPFFDNTIGPFIEDEEGAVGQGDIRVAIFGANECYWEPGLRFEKSPWHVVEQARPLSQVEQMPGFMLGKGKLTPDADTRALSFKGKSNQGDRKLVLVSEYLERPCPEYPEGRWITMANGQRILPDRPYPGDGQEPVLRKLSYASDPDADRDLGLVPQLLDAMRTHNDANNKAVEWKNLCLFPQWAVTPGVMKKQRRTTEPGKIYEIPEPERHLKVIEPPQVPNELFEMADRAERDIGRVAAQNDIPAQVESGKGIQALIEKDSARRAAFIADLAEWHSQVAHDCLVLVQQHYNESRLVQIKGVFGWESIQDFKGAQLKDQVDVRVFPDSIEPRTKQSVENKVVAFADRGWISPEAAMAAIDKGSAEGVVRAYELAEARAGQIIQRIKSGTLFGMPPRPVFPGEDPGYEVEPEYQLDETGQPVIDPMTGEPIEITPGVLATTIPGWMPRPFDNLTVHLSIFSEWMQTADYDALDPDQMQAANSYYAALLQLEAQKAQREAELQTEMAEGLGMKNAAKPQGAKPMPDQASPNGQPSGEVFSPRYQTGSTTTF